MDHRSSNFIADARALKLRFPVSAIALRTGDDKGNVSVWLRGLKPASIPFLLRFYTAFKKELEAIGIHRNLRNLYEQLPPEKTELTEQEAFLEKIDKKLSELLALSHEMSDRSARMEDKIDTLIKYRKFGHQLWQKN